MPAAESEHADEDQSYEWVQTAQAYGDMSVEFVEALVRNAHETSVFRIIPIRERRRVIARIKELGRADAYNARAPHYFQI